MSTPTEIIDARDMELEVAKLRKSREQYEKLARQHEKELLEDWASDFMWKYDNLIVRYLCIMMREHFVQGHDGPYFIPDEFINEAIDLHCASFERHDKTVFATELYRDLMSYNQIATKIGTHISKRLGVRAINALRELVAKRLNALGYHFECDANDSDRYASIIPETFVSPIDLSSSVHFGKIFLRKPSIFNRFLWKIKKALSQTTSRPFLGL